MDYNVLDFGAKGDGKTLDTIAFRKAILACSVTGGRVLVTQGCYLLETIELKNNVELHLEEGAKLLYYFKKSNEEGASLVKTPTFDACDYDGKPKNYFIYAYQSKNISITGKGIIDGNEEVFYGKVTKWHIDGYFYPRVPMIYFEDCKDVKIEQVTLTRSAFWTTHLVGCQDVVIDSITILNNLRLANCDGIDPDHCKNVLIKNSYISCADDCIVFKTTAQNKKYGDLENIVVENCTLISTSAAIKFGTESVSNMHNIQISNCTIKNSNRGICLQLRDEGSIYNVSFQNIKIDTRRFSPIYWWGKAEPVILTAVRRSSTTIVGKIYDIHFKNLEMNSENGIFIFGTNKNIKNITFTDLNLNINYKTDWDHNTYDLRPSFEFNILKEENHPVYLNSCQSIQFLNFQYQMDEEMKKYLNPDFKINDCDEIGVNGLCRS